MTMSPAVACARLFSRPEGTVVLSHLIHLTQKRVVPPEAPDSVLRFIEGQRALVALILSLIQQGQHERNLP